MWTMRRFRYSLHRFYGLPLDYSGLLITFPEPIVKLAHRFQFDMVISEIEDHLLSLELSKAKKWFAEADTYQRTRLTSKIISNLEAKELNALCKQAKQSQQGSITETFFPRQRRLMQRLSNKIIS
ncbi:hypothetical protein L596_023108 [Steinernema carpocapsae]|uniref:Uncharacterized protein n=1 Tax=Steinernema carpocapsae TaxID=34508 RepID=A0A4U5MCM7_STECR|nr:hypothetical protein L596_023108 [Steinernema carpocapsae]